MQVRTTVNRLLKLAEFLEKLPRKRFDYGKWLGDDFRGHPDLSCGTVACAMGWAPQVPALKRAGLGMRINRVPATDWNAEWFTAEPTWCGKTVGGEWLAAARKVFGIAQAEALYLFAPFSFEYDWEKNKPEDWSKPPQRTATAKQVAKHIRRFCDWKLRSSQTKKSKRAK